jgi:hypothetical protein
MQESLRPECGATVGGRSHALNSDNMAATEFLSEVHSLPSLSTEDVRMQDEIDNITL